MLSILNNLNKKSNDYIFMILMYLSGKEIFLFQNICYKYKILINENNFITNIAYKYIININYSYDIGSILNIVNNSKLWKKLFYIQVNNYNDISKLLLISHIKLLEENISTYTTTINFSNIYQLVYNICTHKNQKNYDGYKYCIDIYKISILNFLKTKNIYEIKFKFIYFLSKTFMYLDKYLIKYENQYNIDQLLKYGIKLLNQ